MTAKLQNLFKLSSKITIYIPSTADINKPIDNSAFVDEAATLFSNCFGGATSCETLGYWCSPSAGLVKERTTMVFAYCSDVDLQNHTDKVIDFALKVKAELAQDAVAVEINGEMYFV